MLYFYTSIIFLLFTLIYSCFVMSMILFCYDNKTFIHYFMKGGNWRFIFNKSESCKQLRLPFSVTMKTLTHVWTEKPFRLSRCVKDHAFLSSGKNNTLSLKPVESCVRYRLNKTGRGGRGRVEVHISALPFPHDSL